VYRSTSSSGTYTKVFDAYKDDFYRQNTGSGRLYRDYGLTENTTYYYKVSAYNSDGESALSANASAKVSTVTTLSGEWRTYDIFDNSCDQSIEFEQDRTFTYHDYVFNHSGSGTYVALSGGGRVRTTFYYGDYGDGVSERDFVIIDSSRLIDSWEQRIWQRR